ncbi:hypothetical protein KJ953_00410 [Patescibacteria group bacterium]|nr:hypothetical protein [Patescibacteria group bacterium]MBU1256662.1 hypothetical protein [Patescibacteria group bacterium]MBU1457150.1 hypothetical protein [Patescibacteria group bacterium]MBU2464678.1 hypothetical protein [Candidatus Edwardsbacteria bacterium]
MSAGLNIENRIVEITTGALTNGLEKKASKSAQTAESTESWLSDRVSEFALEKLGLDQDQTDQLKAFLESQAVEKAQLEQSQEEESQSLEDEIKQAREKAFELSEKATERRKAIESKRVFKGLLEKITS